MPVRRHLLGRFVLAVPCSAVRSASTSRRASSCASSTPAATTAPRRRRQLSCAAQRHGVELAARLDSGELVEASVVALLARRSAASAAGQNGRREPVVLEQQLDARESGPPSRSTNSSWTNSRSWNSLSTRYWCLLGVEISSSPSSASTRWSSSSSASGSRDVLDRLEGDDQVEGTVLERELAERPPARTRRRGCRPRAWAMVRLVEIDSRPRPRSRSGQERGAVALSAGRVEHARDSARARRLPGSARGARRAPAPRAGARAQAARRSPAAATPSAGSVMAAPARSSPSRAHTGGSPARARPLSVAMGPTRSSATGPSTPRHASPGAAEAPGRSSLTRWVPLVELAARRSAPTARAC